MAELWFTTTFGEVRLLTEEQFVQKCVGELSRRLSFRAITADQQWAWERLARAVHNWAIADPPLPAPWLLLFEYMPPLVTRRSDLVVVGDGFALVIEAKTGESSSRVSARKQAVGYAEDLYWNHSAARNLRLVPAFLRWRGRTSKTPVAIPQRGDRPTSDMCHELLPPKIVSVLHDLSASYSTGELINRDNWNHAAYAPHPDVVQAAVALVAGLEDQGISAALADDAELDRIAGQLVSEVHQAAEGSKHRLLLVTGVPGSGKTLVGLRLAHDRSVVTRLKEIDPTTALFLTGNKPLVDVLTEALTRDLIHRREMTRAEAERIAGVGIKLVHAFARAGLADEDNMPIPHVAVFDEGQRMWEADRLSAKHGLGRGGEISEPEIILRQLEKRTWAVVVVLIGDGQEIHTGEAGAHLWSEAVLSRNAAGARWSALGSPSAITRNDGALERSDALHLRHNRRAIGAASMSEWVDQVLAGDQVAALAAVAKMGKQFPILVTRDLDATREWLRSREAWTRYGLVASSRSSRLRAYGIEMDNEFQAGIAWPKWFLDRPPSLLASTALEVAASEFKCQGLELDYVGVLWSWDMIRHEGKWKTRRLEGDRLAWREPGGRSASEKRRFALNAYRVLLTRARKGLVIWVPTGAEGDPTRPPHEMDDVADYLVRCGGRVLTGIGP